MSHYGFDSNYKLKYKLEDLVDPIVLNNSDEVKERIIDEIERLGMTKTVVFGGSFNPPTLAHKRLLLAAVEELGAEKGIFVPSSDAYVREKMKKAGYEEETLPDRVRFEMLSAMCEDDERLEVSDIEFEKKGKTVTYETMLAIDELYYGEKLFLAGYDKVEIIPRWRRIDEFLRDYRIIVVKRDGYDPMAAIEASSKLRDHRETFVVIDAVEGLDGISSSAIREGIRNGDDSVREMCHPRVWKMLMAQKDVICGFFDEYRFLSNFYEAPVEYEGIVYQNNEAAFQAQKCMTYDEKLAFTELSPNKAKSLGRKVQLRPDWEKVKVGIMEEIVHAKFLQNGEIARELLATGDRILEEGNTWNDTFWGVSLKTRKGKNNLGKILMKVREELKEDLRYG